MKHSINIQIKTKAVDELQVLHKSFEQINRLFFISCIILAGIIAISYGLLTSN